MPLNRVTFSSSVLLIRTNLAKVQRQYEEAAIPATTGKKINTLSDDATALSKLFNLKSDLVYNEQFQKNITSIKNRLNFSEAQISGGNDILQSIRELGIRASDPTIPAALRDELGGQIAEFKEQLLTFANARLDGKYIFSGTATSTEPFQDSGGGVIVFSANSNSSSIQVNPNVNITATLDGNTIWSGNTDTAVGSTLATTLRNSNGVPFNLSAGDTVTIAGDVTGAFSTTFTIGATTTLANIATQIQTAIRANGDGTETATVRPDGSIRITSGTQAVNDITLSVSGNTAFNTAFTYNDIASGGNTADSNALLTGTGEDIFDVIDDIQAAIEDGDQNALGTHLTRLDGGITQLLNARSTIGIRMQQAEAIESDLSEQNSRILESLTQIEDDSLDKILSNLVLRENALRTVFATSTRILGVTSNIQLGN